MRKSFLALWAALAVSTFSLVAQAQTPTAWPASKSISVVVPFAAGGGVDHTARMVANKLAERLGQSVVVENLAGAGGILGTTKVVRAAPDGYTLLVTSVSTLVISPLVTPDAVKYDPLIDLVPVGLINITPFILVASPTLPLTNFGDLLRYARANPGKLNYASPGAGNLLHVAMEALRQQAGINMVHVPYKSGSQLLTDLISGQVDLTFLSPSTGLPQIRIGKIKALGLTVDERLTAAPGIAPLSDSPELKGYFVTTTIGAFVPARTPQAIIDRLNRELNAILAYPEVRKSLDEQSATVGKGSSADFTELLRKELARNAVVVKAANIKGE